MNNNNKLNDTSIETIIKEFSKGNEFDISLLYEMIDKKEYYIDIFIYLLEVLYETYCCEDNEFNRCVAINTLYFLGQSKAIDAHSVICKLTSLPSIDYLLGDIITSTLDVIIMSTYNGNINIIKSYIENKNTDEWVRLAFLSAYGKLTVIGLIDRSDCMDYLKFLMENREKFSNDKLYDDSIINVAMKIRATEIYDELIRFYDVILNAVYTTREEMIIALNKPFDLTEDDFNVLRYFEKRMEDPYLDWIDNVNSETIYNDNYIIDICETIDENKCEILDEDCHKQRTTNYSKKRKNQKNTNKRNLRKKNKNGSMKRNRK